MQEARWLLFILMAGFLLVVIGYVFIRAVSFAYFRTKLEYLRSVMKAARRTDHGSE